MQILLSFMCELYRAAMKEATLESLTAGKRMHYDEYLVDSMQDHNKKNTSLMWGSKWAPGVAFLLVREWNQVWPHLALRSWWSYGISSFQCTSQMVLLNQFHWFRDLMAWSWRSSCCHSVLWNHSDRSLNLHNLQVLTANISVGSSWFCLGSPGL